MIVVECMGITKTDSMRGTLKLLNIHSEQIILGTKEKVFFISWIGYTGFKTREGIGSGIIF